VAEFGVATIPCARKLSDKHNLQKYEFTHEKIHDKIKNRRKII
jgi:hypothetical protein